MTWGDEGGARLDDENAFELLAPLVAAATVRIHPPPTGYAEGEPVPPPWGSGFFVAPEWVLTCAHVALSGGGAQGGRREVGLTFRGVDRPVPGRVEWARPEAAPWDGGTWPAPDLALVRLHAPPPPPPEGPGCVWLSERTARLFTRDEVAFFGSTEIAGEVVDVSGRCTVKGEMGSEGLLRLGNEDELLHGISGGPLVDLARGEVIGVVKGRRAARDGGLATSVIQLRRLPAPAGPVLGLGDDLYQAVVHGHDAYHAERHLGADSGQPTWTDAQNQLPAATGVLTPGQRVKLLGLMAALPPPLSTPRLDALVGELRGRPYEGSLPAPRGWRDGFGLLHELRGEFTGLEAVLRYALHVATDERPYPAKPGREKRLLERMDTMAEDAPTLPRRVRKRLQLEKQARLAHADPWWATRQPMGVDRLLAASVVRLDSLAVLELDSRFWEANGYDWRVCARPSGRNDPIDGATEVGDLRRPPERLLAALVEAFRRGDEPGSPVPLQVAVPYSLLQVPFDQWRLTPDGPTLGEVRPVVVRCTDPMPGAEDGEELATLRRARWVAAHEGRLVADVLDCHDGLPRALPERSALLGRELTTVPVLCRAPAVGGEPAALHRVMASGYNVILWQRELAARDASCDHLHDSLAHLVGGGACDRLVESLWRMREAAGTAPDGMSSPSWMSDLALLYGEPEGEVPEEDFLEAP
ncbi:trypsin-like peptidase domain-containing protein [Streptomyces sedi]|uniref:vWA-MoxR associated protein C-terminal domain-containing protein n=1 Tax=Streptomyces sedi TaxID=555059 RepID=A0A5C4VAL6_9ACTN|nr:trypsin-like peptidase domain-containing protein [Streptomyces sedi]TNM32963.1 hypothetical protein FH715_06600 [Streptomyces sedi]